MKNWIENILVESITGETVDEGIVIGRKHNASEVPTLLDDRKLVDIEEYRIVEDLPEYMIIFSS